MQHLLQYVRKMAGEIKVYELGRWVFKFNSESGNIYEVVNYFDENRDKAEIKEVLRAVKKDNEYDLEYFNKIPLGIVRRFIDLLKDENNQKDGYTS